MRIYWCRSEKVDVHREDGQQLTSRCETRARLLTDGYWATIGRRRYLRLIQVPSEGGGQSDTAIEYRGVDVVPSPPGDRRVLSAHRRRKPAVPIPLLIATGVASSAVSHGFDFLISMSIIFIAVQAVIAINFHLLSSSLASEPRIKSHDPFRFRAIEEAILSCTFAVAGVASLTGLLPAGNLAGWLAMGAAAVGVANLIATRR